MPILITREEMEALMTEMRLDAIQGNKKIPRLDHEYKDAVDTGDWATFEASLVELAHDRLSWDKNYEEWAKEEHAKAKFRTPDEFHRRNALFNPFNNLPNDSYFIEDET